MTDIDNLPFEEINIFDPTPELLDYINRTQNLIAYYAPKFLTDDIHADPEYNQLPQLDRHLILAFAFASLDIDTYEVLHRER